VCRFLAADLTDIGDQIGRLVLDIALQIPQASSGSSFDQSHWGLVQEVCDEVLRLIRMTLCQRAWLIHKMTPVWTFRIQGSGSVSPKWDNPSKNMRKYAKICSITSDS
jgi:hypothetical protein